MKKKNIYTLISIIFGIIIFFSIYILIVQIKGFSVSEIEKSLVIIIPEKKLIDFKENPEGILGFEENPGIGMGFFINNDGKILSVEHIVKDTGTKYIVKTYNNKEFIAEVISKDKKNDLAILKINSNNEFNPLKFGKEKRKINLGDKIISFGVNIDKLKSTYIYGKITGIGTRLEELENLIEFSPIIKKGFSGGPIINKYGEVIGINSSIYNDKSYGIKLK